ncbi:MAG: lipid A deacylase LpxR family protein [Pseudomonadota bacterium]
MAATLAIGLGGHAAAQSGALPETSPAGPPISEGGALSVTVENDLVADTDRDYTSGVRLDYITPRNQLSPFGDVAKRQLNPWLKAEDWYEIYAVGQTIFTPTDISAPPARGDRPYAGFLYGSFGVAADSGDQLNTVVLDVGVVGPLSGAEQTQKYVHDIIDAAKPVGWDLQLENEPAFRVLYEHKRRAFLDLSLPFFDLGVDMLPHANVSLGTLDISAGAGVTLRLGAGLLDDYGPPRVRPAVGAPGFFSTNRFFRWYLFAGAEGRAVGRNLLLEGNTFGGRDGVTINPFVGDFQVGAAAGLGAVELSYTHVLRTEEYAAQPGFAEFGSFNIRTKF